MKKLRSKFDRPPLPDHLQWAAERNVGRLPTWVFPPIPPTPGGFYFEKLDFTNRLDLLDAFAHDPDEWVDHRFKTPDAVYEYVAELQFETQFSWKHGGADWLVRAPDHACAGVLHGFDFSREQFGFNHRKCAVGFAFAQKFRGSGLAAQALRQFENYLFQKMDRLYLVAWTDPKNARCLQFLKKSGWEERARDHRDDDPDWARKTSEHVYFEKFRSRRTRAAVLAHRAESEKKYRAWRAKWIKNEDGSWTVPTCSGGEEMDLGC